MQALNNTQLQIYEVAEYWMKVESIWLRQTTDKLSSDGKSISFQRTLSTTKMLDRLLVSKGDFTTFDNELKARINVFHSFLLFIRNRKECERKQKWLCTNVRESSSVETTIANQSAFVMR